MTLFLDTNVLVYAVDDRDRTKQQIALELIAGDPRELVVSGQVLGEFFVTVTRKLHRKLSVGDARQMVDDLAHATVVDIDAALVTAAIDTATRHQLSYWDALILEAAVRGGCDRILTEDLTNGQTIRGVQIVNPFAAA